jgi:hypothetical protein
VRPTPGSGGWRNIQLSWRSSRPGCGIFSSDEWGTTSAGPGDCSLGTPHSRLFQTLLLRTDDDRHFCCDRSICRDGHSQRLRVIAENPEREFVGGCRPADDFEATYWAGKNLCRTSIVSRSDHLLEELLGNRAPLVRAHVPNLLLFRRLLVGWDTGRNKHAETKSSTSPGELTQNTRAEPCPSTPVVRTTPDKFALRAKLKRGRTITVGPYEVGRRQ